jgi:hypothetical protein
VQLSALDEDPVEVDLLRDFESCWDGTLIRTLGDFDKDLLS